jgi:glycerophosphoryl diester phosphodiesterase
LFDKLNPVEMAEIRSDFFAGLPPRIFAHRGFSGKFPENTLPSFRAARDAGSPYIECDVHMTRDGVVVVHHDGDLKRTCGRDEIIAELDYAALARADAGFTFSFDGVHFPFRGQGIRVPTLAEVLTAAPDCRFIIEIKQTGPTVVPAMFSVIDQTQMARRVLIASEHHAPLAEARKIRPEIPTSFAGAEIAAFFQALANDDRSYQPPADALQIPQVYESMRLATAESVAFAHRLGLEVHVWTVDNEEEMSELLLIGVDGIITNFPDRLIAVCRSRAAH